MKEQEINSKTQLDILKERISYNEPLFQNIGIYEQVLLNLLEDSKFIALSLRYPFDDTKEELPNTPKYKNWQIRCALELYNLLKSGGSNFITYSENGISWTRDSSIISSSLRNEIQAKVGIPRKEANIEDTFDNLYKPIYIARKDKVEYDDYNNEIVTYKEPFFFGNWNYQPLQGNDLMAYMSAYGETKNKLVRVFINSMYRNTFKEYDLAYLYGITPEDELIYGEKANYRVRTFAEQNTKIMVVFEEIIKEEEIIYESES